MDFPSKSAFIESLPAFLKNPSIWIPIMVAFYVGILGLCLTGALQRQKVQIKRVRDQKKSIFSMLDEDEDEKKES